MACQTTVVSCQTKITKWSVRLFVRTKWPVRLQLSDQNGLSDILSDQNCLTLTHYCQTKIGSILYDTNKTIVAKRCRLFTIQTAFASQPKNSSRGNNHKTTLLTVADQPLSRTWNIPCLELKESADWSDVVREGWAGGMTSALSLLSTMHLCFYSIKTCSCNVEF